MCRNIEFLAGVVYFIRRYKFPFAPSVLTTPAGKMTIVKISKLVIPATPPLKGGETYLAIIQIDTIVFVIIAFLRLTAMPPKGFVSISNSLSPPWGLPAEATAQAGI